MKKIKLSLAEKKLLKTVIALILIQFAIVLILTPSMNPKENWFPTPSIVGSAIMVKTLSERSETNCISLIPKPSKPQS